MRNKTLSKLTVLHDSNDAAGYLKSIWDVQTISIQEKIYLVFLDRHNHVIDSCCFATGDQISCSFDMERLLQMAVLHNAKSVLFAHNHPGCDSRPSKADKEATEELYIKLRCVGLNLYDHVIVTEKGLCMSFKREGFFDDYECIYQKMMNMRIPGTFEYITGAVIEKFFKRLIYKEAPTFAFDELKTNFNKLFTKFYDPII